MRTVMISWLGITDILDWRKKTSLPGQDNPQPIKPGPIERALLEYADAMLPEGSELAELHVLSSWGDRSKDGKLITQEQRRAEVEGFVDWMKYKTQATVSYSLQHLTNVTDLSSLYLATTQALAALAAKYHNTQLHFVFHISSGTPSMQAIWLLLAKTEFPGAELIKTSIESGLERVDFPFDIAVKYQPYFNRSTDDKPYRIQGLDTDALATITWRSPQMQEALHLTANVARHDNMHVLLEGESGVGKELFARLIHQSSERRHAPFITVNCGALPELLIESELFGYKKGAFTGADQDKEGKFQQADGGILFLDEIGDLPREQQVKLLRLTDTHTQVISPVGSRGKHDERTVNVRIVAATNLNLMAKVADGSFRQDLFFRLAVGHIQIPALRERAGDLDLLIDHFVKKLNTKSGKSQVTEKHLTADARQLLHTRSWPGNVRELEHTLTKALWLYSEGHVVSREDIRRALLPLPEPEIAGADILQRPLDENLDLEGILTEVKGHYVLRAMREAGSSNLAAVARLLNMKEVTFRNQLYRETSPLKKFLTEHPEGCRLLKK